MADIQKLDDLFGYVYSNIEYDEADYNSVPAKMLELISKGKGCLFLNVSEDEAMRDLINVNRNVGAEQATIALMDECSNFDFTFIGFDLESAIKKSGEALPVVINPAVITSLMNADDSQEFYPLVMFNFDEHTMTTLVMGNVKEPISKSNSINILDNPSYASYRKDAMYLLETFSKQPHRAPKSENAGDIEVKNV